MVGIFKIRINVFYSIHFDIIGNDKSIQYIYLGFIIIPAVRPVKKSAGRYVVGYGKGEAFWNVLSAYDARHLLIFIMDRIFFHPLECLIEVSAGNHIISLLVF